MAAPDPRRSSRARAHSQSQQSSTTSSISGRAERTTRSLNKSGSPQKSTPTGSLSSEPPDDLIEASDDHLLRPRRTRSNNEDRENKATNPDDNEMATNGADDIQEDDEAVRCICGHEDYPGPPSLEDLKRVAKEGIDLEAVFPTEITEDLAGFFVQCDVCHVWQHGACVGLSNDDTLPEEYFCEECREDFHRIFKTSLGRRFSLYLPLERNSRAVSLVKEGTRSPKGKETRNSKASAASQSSKRRSTMNSRDAAYDEEEQLRRAIEASREDNSTDGAEVATRRTKRGRSGSEEKLEAAPKRQRTSSRSPSPQPDKQPEGDESDDQAGSRNGASKKSRNSVAAAARTQREKSEKAEKERQRAEAANKRKGRAERRRADGIQPTILVKPPEAHQDTDSDPSEELPLAARAPTNPPPPPAPEPVQQPEAPVSSHQATPDTPPASAVPMAVSKSKGGRPTHKKKGRNQYTKDRDDGSPARSQSRDVQDTPNSGNTRTGGGEHSKSSRSKGGMNSRVTMSEMKRRATAMFDYISRTQLELAGEASPAQAHASPAGSKDDAPVSTDAPSIVVNGGTSSPKKLAGNKGTENGDKPTKEFKELSCVEMMDYLTRDLVHWQNQFVA